MVLYASGHAALSFIVVIATLVRYTAGVVNEANVAAVHISPTGVVENTLGGMMRSESKQAAKAVDPDDRPLDRQPVGALPTEESDAKTVEHPDDMGPATTKAGGDDTLVSEGSSSEFFPIPDFFNVADVTNRAMDMLTGVTGIIEEDYPFACNCNLQGRCESDIAGTSCAQRAGLMGGARHAAGRADLTLLCTVLLAVLSIIAIPA